LVQPPKDSLEAIATEFFSSRSVRTWNSSSAPRRPQGWKPVPHIRGEVSRDTAAGASRCRLGRRRRRLDERGPRWDGPWPLPPVRRGGNAIPPWRPRQPRCHHRRVATSVAPQALRPGPPRDGPGKEVHRSTSVSTMVPAGIIDAVTLKGMSECRAARNARQLAS
jgi:hypothetical protein